MTRERKSKHARTIRRITNFRDGALYTPSARCYTCTGWFVERASSADGSDRMRVKVCRSPSYLLGRDVGLFLFESGK